MIRTDVILGLGETVVTDVANKDEGWSGIVISCDKARPGEDVDLGIETDESICGGIRILSGNPKSFDAVISALARAKARLE